MIERVHSDDTLLQGEDFASCSARSDALVSDCGGQLADSALLKVHMTLSIRCSVT